MNKENFMEEYQKIVEQDFAPVAKCEWHGMELEIRRCLSVSDAFEFVQSVIDTCFVEDDEGYSVYHPEIKPLAIRCGILERYADLMPDCSLSEKSQICYATDIVSYILNHVNHEQFSDIVDSIDAGIEYRIRLQIDARKKDVDKLVGELEQLGDNLSRVFDGVDSGSLNDLIGALANGRFDEDKLAQAVVVNYKNANNIAPAPLSLVSHPGE